jgi:putative methionine-R-sulfoxide reductase with GAF domain
VVGENDSHGLAAFSAQDKEFLEKCAAIVGGFMERTQNRNGSGVYSLG